VKEGTRQLLDKAGRAIRAAGTLLQDDNLDFAAGRAYYAMFYVAEALLHERDLRSKKHGGVHALFGEQFAKTGILDPKFHRWLLLAFNTRLIGDYGLTVTISKEDVMSMIDQAREFLGEAGKFLGA
jgi:uncharacterized protein (UPF0332 family)